MSSLFTINVYKAIREEPKIGCRLRKRNQQIPKDMIHMLLCVSLYCRGGRRAKHLGTGHSVSQPPVGKALGG